MDGSITMRLRAGLAAAALLGLGGALAPGHAEEAAAPAAVAAAPAAASITPATAPTLPRFAPQAEDSTLTPTPAPDADAEPDDGPAWQPIAGGMASWYGQEFAGHRTASGERFNPADFTAAHRTLPFGTRVRVTDADGDSVIVRINDRGPFARGRVIDLSQAAAKRLGLTRAGSGRVTLAVLDQ
jgi:rare lipoprotein A